MIQLNISNNKTNFNDSEDSSKSVSLNIGSQLIVDRFFSDFPPTYDEIDRAINFTEETLTKIQHLYDNESILYSSDKTAEQIAQLAFHTSKENGYIHLSRKELEKVFSRLADIVKGLPTSQDVLPDSNEFAAYLLIIREITHHLHFEKMLVETEN